MSEEDEIDQVTAEGLMLRAGQDPDAARRRHERTSAIDRRVEPQAIVTTARPTVEWLREARRLLNQEGRIRNFVVVAVQQGLSPEAIVSGLALRLNVACGGDLAAEMREAAQYLWDEQNQLKEGLYIISAETGKAIGVATEADFYRPAPVPREDGTMALSRPRLRPALEAALICRTFDTSREAQLLATLTDRAHQTALLREEGDSRLLIATRAGRRRIVEALTTYDPQILLRATGGTSGAFLASFQLTASDPLNCEGLTLVEGIALSATTANVSDATTTNLKHNRAASVRGALSQGWVREIARQLSQAALKLCAPIEVHPRDLTAEHLKDAPFWVTPPDAVRFVQRAAPSASLMPVPATHLLGIQPSAGTLVVPAGFEALSREMFDRWEASSQLPFKLWVDPTRIRAIRLIDLEHRAQPV